ncbi:hypothetical protein QJS83_16090 [Bdellovibrio sp. 22V]|uniref:PulJ/GspJ family protein n=1 Tax=Bdellovibrio sp. 22V TaxID=3044166 RepID=UPI002543CF5C|nr:hypothetical protein [Bdellovibrio sp. 22V]WII71984.1 hypothetical protein QJS83_16090 [Bdellovibrio sp. 22V]
MKKGFTIVELLLAIGLSTLVIGVTTFLLHQFFNEHRSIEVWSSGQFEMTSTLSDIEGDIRNLVRLDPVENSSVEYFGVKSIPVGAEPGDCLNTPDAPVIRYTSLDRRRRSERVLRAWAELYDSEKSAPANELRLTADSTADSLFTNSQGPREVVLVDADRRYIRRYQVARHVMHLQSPTDPYDDLQKTDNFGQPKTFDYVSVFLRNPLGSDGAVTTKKEAVFITGSEVYPSNTFFLCARKSDRSIVKINQSTQETVVLLQNPTGDFQFDSLRIMYFGTRPGVRVETANFAANMDVNGNCVNTIHIALRLVPTAAALAVNDQRMVKDVKLEAIRRRTIFSPNLNIKRPLSCND